MKQVLVIFIACSYVGHVAADSANLRLVKSRPQRHDSARSGRPAAVDAAVVRHSSPDVQQQVESLPKATETPRAVAEDSQQAPAQDGHGELPSGFLSRHAQPMCDSWQAKYSQLHSDILSGMAKPRYAVAQPDAGLADSLSCIGSVFYYSLITGRAFLLGEVNGEKEAFSAAYEAPNVQWAASAAPLQGLSRQDVLNFWQCWRADYTWRGHRCVQEWQPTKCWSQCGSCILPPLQWRHGG